MKKNRSSIFIILTTAVIVTISIFFLANFMNPHQQLSYVISEPIPTADPRFPDSIGTLLDPAFVGGNKIQTLINGEEIFPAMLEAIKLAEKTITFESYIYWSGEIGERFAKALAEKARVGIKVHILLDWAGSGKISSQNLEMMKSAGVEVQRYHQPHWRTITRLNNRTHRKILVIDGKIGFTGGVGIADEWNGNGLDPKHWRDNHYRIEGPVVAQMQSAFMDNWLKTRPEVHSGPGYFPELKSAGTNLAQMFISSSGQGGSSVRIMYLMALAAAQKTIYLQAAYFVPDQHVIDQLIAARKRGVKIKIIVPGPYNDSDVVDNASKNLWGELLKEGIQIFQYQPALFHCKVLIIDELFVSVGSTNFDQRSFRLNDEANLNIVNAEFAQAQIKLFEKDLSHSKIVTYTEWNNRPVREKILSHIFSWFESQL